MTYRWYWLLSILTCGYPPILPFLVRRSCSSENIENSPVDKIREIVFHSGFILQYQKQVQIFNFWRLKRKNATRFRLYEFSKMVSASDTDIFTVNTRSRHVAISLYLLVHGSQYRFAWCYRTLQSWSGTSAQIWNLDGYYGFIHPGGGHPYGYIWHICL